MGGELLLSFCLLQALLLGSAFDQEQNLIDSCPIDPAFLPSLYDLKLDLNYAGRTFDGQVIVTGRVERETDYVLLDSSVSVSEASLLDPHDQFNHPGRLNQEEELLEVKFDHILLPKTDYRLSLKYTGVIRELRGVFGRNYSTPDGQQSYFIGTELQPNFAKYVFPCVDRPQYKARFRLNITSEQHQMALSNMPLVSTQPDSYDDNKVWNSFGETPPMSTYTFAFVIGDLVPVLTDEFDELINNTVWVTRGNQGLGTFAAKWTPYYIKLMEKFTDVEYVMPKMDHVALPYLDSTGMENWGLITYKQEQLFLDERTHTIRNEFGLIWILAHETIHQWFGNLVTCKTWSYTWLNEGITTFLHFLISGKVFPEWDMLGLMMTEEVIKVMDDDCYSGVSLTKSKCVMDTTDTFSMASYYKGAALMRMVYFLLGEDHFKNGLQNYIKTNKYGSVTQDDLWIHFEEAAKLRGVLPPNKTLGELMESWTNNYGLPYVKVTRKNDSLMLEQAKMIFFPPDDYPDQKWWIPVPHTTSIHKNYSAIIPTTWMNPDSNETYLDIKLTHDDWIIINMEQLGYYRVLYDNVTWGALSRQLRLDLNAIPPLTRAKLVDDAFTLAFFKKLPYSIPLTLSSYLMEETHYYPWSAAIKGIEGIHFFLKSTSLHDKFERYLLRLVEKVYNTISYYNDYNDSYRDTNMRMLHTKVLNFACNLGHKECEQRAYEVMAHLLEGDENFRRKHIDEIIPLMCTMVRLGDEEIWDYAFEMYKKEKVFKPKEDLMAALKCTKKPKIWNKLVANHLLGVEYYNNVDLFTTETHDKKSFCHVIKAIKDFLSVHNMSENLKLFIENLSGAVMAEECRSMLLELVKEHIDEEELKEELVEKLEKFKTPWNRLKEIEEWFNDDTNMIEIDSSSDSGDNNLIERSLFDGMYDDNVDMPYPFHRSPDDYDNDSKKREEQINNSSTSLVFSLYVLLFSVLPSPVYLSYLLFAPFI